MSSMSTPGQHVSGGAVRATLRSTGALGLALVLTASVLVIVATMVDTWA